MKTYKQHIKVGELGVHEFRPFDYLDFYEANIHPYTILKNEDVEHKIYEGITALEFHEIHKKDYMNILQLVQKDKRLCKLQDELEKEGKQVCMFNMYILAKFLIERGKTRYVFLLKPKIADILATLNDVTKVSFTNKDGTVIKSASPKLIQVLMESLEEKKDADQSTFEVDKIVTWDQVSNKSVIQCYFVHDLTMFLNKYFPVKRKKNALVSTKEVELILYLMKLFGLSIVELTNKRHCQLMSFYKQIKTIPERFVQINLDEKKYITNMTFIPYSIWNNGKIDWTAEEFPQLSLKTGDTIKF